MPATGPLGAAFEIAFHAHAGQYDKAGEPYIAHVVRVASRVPEGEAQIVALLHDVVEDTELTLADLAQSFSPDIITAIDAMTKRAAERYDDYLTRVSGNALALQVKRADLADNSDPNRLARLDPEHRVRLERKYAKAQRALI